MSKTLFSLGEIYPSDFLKEGEKPRSEKVEMKLIMDDDGLVRLEKTAELDKMYGRYFYRSGINSTMKEALKNVVQSILKTEEQQEQNFWLDIACNDGTLMSFVPNYYLTIGIDPADDSFKKQSIVHGEIIQDFFSAEVFKSQYGSNKVNVVTSIAMFYDVPDPKKFIKDVYDILEDDGLWVMQLSYSPLMVMQNEFMNICHEHIFYYSLMDLRMLLEPAGFYVDNCELNNVNGGSMRLYIRKGKQEDHPLSEVGQFNVAAICAIEQGLSMDDPDNWRKWFKEIEKLKAKTVTFIREARANGYSVWGYGASTKGNTLLQYFGLDNTLIDAIADRNPDKHGLYTVGSNIRITSEEEMRSTQPDYLLIMPWHFLSEFKERESEYLRKGGKFIVPCPEFRIVTA